MGTSIEWADEVWNLVAERLDLPFKWKKPRKVFVNDLFHDEVDEKFIAKVFGIMWLAQQHTFMILTKRPERMHKLLNDEDFQMHTGWFASQAIRDFGLPEPEKLPDCPNPNVWIGVSVEDQKTANVRIPLLLQTPAAVRFLSCEPLLGPVSIFDVDDTIGLEGSGPGFPKEPQLHWVIAGGESGPGARPMHPEWARTLRDQCESANIPFFFKQWGVWAPLSDLRKEPNCKEGILHENGEFFLGASWLQRDRSGDDQRGDYMQMFRVGKKEAGRLLDGREWNEMPPAQEETAMLAHYCGTCNLTFAVSTDLKDQTDLSCPECREEHELEEIGEVMVKPSVR